MATIMNDNDMMIINDMSNGAIFQASFPYLVSTAAITAVGTYAVLTAVAAPWTLAMTVAAAAVNIFGAYGLLSTIIVAATSKSGSDFKARIKPALLIGGAAVIAEVVTVAARIVLQATIAKALGYNQY